MKCGQIQMEVLAIITMSRQLGWITMLPLRNFIGIFSFFLEKIRILLQLSVKFKYEETIWVVLDAYTGNYLFGFCSVSVVEMYIEALGNCLGHYCRTLRRNSSQGKVLKKPTPTLLYSTFTITHLIAAL